MSHHWSLMVLALRARFNGRVIILTVGIPLCGSHLNGLSLFLTGFMAFMDAFCGAVRTESFGVRRTPVKAVSKTLALAPSQRDLYRVRSVFIYLYPYYLYSFLPYFLLYYLYYPLKFRLCVLYKVGHAGVSIYAQYMQCIYIIYTYQ